MHQFSSPNTPEYNDLSERDWRTIMDLSRYIVSGTALPNSLWGKSAATVMFMLNHPPSNTIGGGMSFNRMFSKYVDLFFLRTAGTRPHGGRQ